MASFLHSRQAVDDIGAAHETELSSGRTATAVLAPGIQFGSMTFAIPL